MQATRYVFPLAVFAVSLQGSQDSVRDEGIAAFNQGRYSVAFTKLKQAEKDPADRLAAVFLGLTEAAVGDCQSALPVLKNPQIDGVIQRLSGLATVKCYSSAGNTGDALSSLQKLQQEFPNDPDVLYLAAKLHMKAFNDATLAMFQRAPASYRVHELSAEIFEVQARYPDAVAEYRKAIDLNPNAPDLHYRLGRALLLQSHDPTALQNASQQFEAELQVSPEDSASEFQLGQIAQVKGNAAQAQLHLERAVTFSPKFAAALVALGKIYLQTKDFERAVSTLNRAIAIQPGNEAAHYALLTVYRNQGQMDKAKAEKAALDRLQKPPQGEFSDFLNKLGEKQNPQQ